MEKQRLNEEQYIAKLNEVLQQHPDYTPDMRFMAYPEGARGGNITGVAIAGFGYNRAYMDSNNAVQAAFDLELTYAGFQREIR